MKLYKYRRVNNDTLSSIRESTLWFSSPADFNDPYDCQLSMDPSGTKEAWRLFLVNNLPFVKNSPVSKNELIRRFIDDKQIHTRPGYAKELFQRVIDEIRSSIGVCCFSRIDNSIPMWSHYADGHKGICIEYDSEKDIGFGNVKKVNYSEEYPNTSIRDTKDEIMNKLITSKARAWDYEDEYRLVSKTGKVPLMADRKSMTGIIFGCLCPLQAKEKILNALKAYVPMPKLYEAKAKQDKYEISIVECDENSILWRY
ncbi:MAG: DUF2971 domain-containing protein [bacterium]|nr:DUF2971 domain-containing protein [bacterium]